MRDAVNSPNPKGHEEYKGIFFQSFVPFVFKIFSRENLWAFLLFLIVIALIIFTTDNSPIWIYQGF
jgi:hypothetical protein